MNNNYWVYSPEFICVYGPFTLRQAMKEKAIYDNYGENVLILKTIIGPDGREVK